MKKTNYKDVLNKIWGQGIENALRTTSKRDMRHHLNEPQDYRWMEFYKVPCPLCGHKGMCLVNPENDQILCCRSTQIATDAGTKDAKTIGDSTWVRSNKVSTVDGMESERWVRTTGSKIVYTDVPKKQIINRFFS